MSHVLTVDSGPAPHQPTPGQTVLPHMSPLAVTDHRPHPTQFICPEQVQVPRPTIPAIQLPPLEDPMSDSHPISHVQHQAIKPAHRRLPKRPREGTTGDTASQRGKRLRTGPVTKHNHAPAESDSANFGEKLYKIVPVKSECLDTRPRNVVCNLCRESFVSQIGFHSHYFLRHDRGQKFSCLICEAKHKKMKTLRQHLIAAHGATDYPYPCHKCARGFFKLAKLQAHLELHI